MDLVNLSPFAALQTLSLGPDGRETLLVVVRATFFVATSGRMSLTPVQAPPVVADAYRGEPDRSSLVACSDLVFEKPRCDVLVSGHAYADARRPGERLVSLRFAGREKQIWVSGDRVWERSMKGLRPSAPAPFDRLPLIWERAYGGADARDPTRRCAENPVGLGFRGDGSGVQAVADGPVPNLEDPATLLAAGAPRPRSACLGPVAPHWAPRLGRAGTYDDAWRTRRCPLLPDDFDPAFNQAASDDQQLPTYIAGGEPLSVDGVSPDGPLEATVPVVAPRVVVRLAEQQLEPPCRCDTVVIDGDARTLSLVWRASVAVQGAVSRLSWTKVQLLGR